MRVSSLSQELEADPRGDAAGAGAGAAGGRRRRRRPPAAQPGGGRRAGQPPAARGRPRACRRSGCTTPRGPTTSAAQYNLAITGFENYIRTFPRSEQAGDAQYFIGESYYQQGMFKEAAAAYDRGITDYPNSQRIPDMYFKRGMAFNALGQIDRARESWEYVVKTFPNSDAGRLARQRLDQIDPRERTIRLAFRLAR